MKTLVTGSDGLIGCSIRNLGLTDYYFATRKDADLQNFDQTMSLFSKVKPKRVIHLAALVGGIGGNSLNSADYFMGNIRINTNTLEAARLNGVERLVSFMSTCVFPDEVSYPLIPSSLHSGPPHPSNFGYAYSKRMLEVQTRAYRLQWGLNYAIAIPANVYGPNDNFDLKNGHVVPSLIRKVFESKIQDKPLQVWGTGKSLREFIYSEDIARLAVWMLDNYHDFEPLILSSGQEISIHDLVKIIVELMNFTGKILFDESKPDGQYRKPSDNSELKKLHPGFSFTPVATGLLQTISWFENYYPTIRGLAKDAIS
jgi:GDP-L-fucose synthase